ncbi:MAG: flagellar protein FlgN [Chloroflexota bacterium]|jgi:flagellar biosynthesis/type III secretory pathway chaperone
MDQNKNKTVTVLEDALVNEFRIFQSLVALSREELDSLTRRDSQRLSVLVEEKESLLDELSQLEESRRMATEDLAYAAGLNLEMPAVSDVLPYLDKMTHDRLKRILEGIIALGREIRNLNRTNMVLAKTALDWADATQSYLINLHQPEFETYAPGGVAKRQNAVRSFDHWV